MHIKVSGQRQVDVLSPVLEGGVSILYKEQLVFIFNMWYNLFLGRLSAFFTEYFLLGKGPFICTFSMFRNKSHQFVLYQEHNGTSVSNYVS